MSDISTQEGIAEALRKFDLIARAAEKIAGVENRLVINHDWHDEDDKFYLTAWDEVEEKKKVFTINYGELAEYLTKKQRIIYEGIYQNEIRTNRTNLYRRIYNSRFRRSV